MKKILAILIFTLSFIGLSGAARAYYYDGNGMYHCRWVRAHWSHGVWYPAQRLCYSYEQTYRYHCRWMPAHSNYGVWYPAQKVCWTR